MWLTNLFFGKKEMTKETRVLIITKSKTVYGEETPETLSTGLSNSVNHIMKCLINTKKLSIKTVNVIDNNCIDREVSLYKPDIVIIEALWVVPSKFEVLKKLHPKVTWIIRLHSKLPFISGEGVALDWIAQYIEQSSVYVACNSQEMLNDLRNIFLRKSEKFVFLPNMYFIEKTPEKVSKSPIIPKEIHIGCFGALRPLKNQLAQAVAAIQFADKNDLKLFYYINSSRKEGFSSDNILKNIRSLFSSRNDHSLVECEWYSQKDFFEVIKSLDIGLQVSYSETFNMVSGDFVSCGVPIVVSSEIPWMSNISIVRNPNSINDISSTIDLTLLMKKCAVNDSLDKLKSQNKEAKKEWISTLNSI